MPAHLKIAPESPITILSESDKSHHYAGKNWNLSPAPARKTHSHILKHDPRVPHLSGSITAYNMVLVPLVLVLYPITNLAVSTSQHLT